MIHQVVPRLSILYLLTINQLLDVLVENIVIFCPSCSVYIFSLLDYFVLLNQLLHVQDIALFDLLSMEKVVLIECNDQFQEIGYVEVLEILSCLKNILNHFNQM